MMKPEQPQQQIDVWVLAKLTPSLMPKGSYGIKPYSIAYEQEVYFSLADAQQAQTFTALKDGIKYEIFHLEFPTA